MASASISGGRLDVRFTPFEKVTGLVRDQVIPLTSVRQVEVVDDGLSAVRGIRAPGLGAPGIRKIGTWRGRFGKSLVSVKRDQPALRIDLDGHRYAYLILGFDDAKALASRIDNAR